MFGAKNVLRTEFFSKHFSRTNFIVLCTLIGDYERQRFNCLVYCFISMSVKECENLRLVIHDCAVHTSELYHKGNKKTSFGCSKEI